MARVFVNFRNGDEPFAAALLYAELTRLLGPDAVFRSSDCIEPGDDWAEVIWDHHRRSELLVAVIGPRWLTMADDRGRHRLRQRDDWVRAEIAAALQAGKPVIPVLVQGAKRFRRSDLPQSIAGLAALQSVTMDHRNAQQAVAALVAALTRHDPPSTDALPPADRFGVPSRSAGWLTVWNVPSRLPFFVDRVEPLALLKADIAAARGGRPVVIHGGVGSGKSQLALEYAYRYAGDYELAWWVSGARPELLVSELAALAAAVGFETGPDVTAALPALFAEIRRRGRYLLVFDGIEDPAALSGLLGPVGGGGDVLITSRRADWGLGVAARPVGNFRREESVRLLDSRLGGVPAPELDQLAAALDDIPLAVAQAAIYLDGLPISVRQYVELLATRAGELLARGDTHVYPGSLAAAWSVGLERLRAAFPGADGFLQLVAVLAPAPIPLDVLESVGAALPPALAARLADPIERADLVRAIERSGLVLIADGQLHTPGLFQSFVRAGLGDVEVERLREGARQAVALAPRPDPREPDSAARYALLLPHVLALDVAASDHPACHRLLLDAAQHLVVRADVAVAAELVASALADWRDRYEPDAESTLGAASQLAQAYFRLGRYPEALALDEEVLTRRRRAAGPDHPDTLTAAHNVAMAGWAANGADGAGVRALLEQVAADRGRVLGEAHPDTLRSVHNFALSRRAAGDYATARELDEANHRRLSAVLGADHPDALRSAYGLALDLRALGRVEAARDLDADTYERRRRVLGEDHPDTLRSGYAVAVDLRNAGDAPRARAMAADTYERRRRVLGDDHVDTLRAGYLYGLALDAAGDQAAGERLRRDTGERLSQLRGGDRSAPDPLD